MSLLTSMKNRFVLFTGAMMGSGLLSAEIKDNVPGAKFVSKVQANDKVVVITGANSGIGLEAARDLASRGAEVYMVCRNMKKCLKARQEVIEDSNNERIYCCECDLSSQQSIRDFAERFKKERNRLDILINNAGVMKCKKDLTKEGIELQLGVNHMGHFLLTNLLLDVLKASKFSRILVVTDQDYVKGHIDKDDLNSERKYDKGGAYYQSKLANILFVRELAKRLEGTSVTVNAVNPGKADTYIHRHLWYTTGLIGLIVEPILWHVWKTAPAGAQTTLYAALNKGLKKKSGLYFSECKTADLSGAAQDDETGKWLWQVSEKWTGLAT